mmetsp:Transcript_24867/g.81851  ORF Transcript_24867/g.81851 Transcript_24867/m.81851 type:complete len:88 (+) Transcript_24867:110-373(+)
MVLNHFGKKSITAQACEQIIGSAVPAALQQKNIRAIGQAQMADDEAIGKMIDNFAPGQVILLSLLLLLLLFFFRFVLLLLFCLAKQP